MITSKIKDLSGLLTSPEPTDDKYSRFNDGSVECEVGEFLYGMVRLIKPAYILETGLYHGISTAYMALALKENRDVVASRYLGGHINTLEIETEHIQTSKELFNKLGVQGFVTIHQKYSLDYDPENKCDLIFLDSEPSLRFAELVKFYKALNPGGYVFLHDAPYGLCQGNINPDHLDFPSWPWGNIPQELKDLVNKGELRPFFFPNPRGMCGFYRPKQEEYKWK